jgi:hypothetical protein
MKTVQTPTLETPEQVPALIDLTAIEAELRPLNAEKIRFRFLECYQGAARMLAEAAVCVKLLKERGNSLEGIPMVGTFLRVASGQILPELVWKFLESANRPIVEGLPLPDQQRVVSDPMVPVIEPKVDGGFTTRMVNLTSASRDVARLAVGPDGIRSLGHAACAAGVSARESIDHRRDTHRAAAAQVHR